MSAERIMDHASAVLVEFRAAKRVRLDIQHTLAVLQHLEKAESEINIRIQELLARACDDSAALRTAQVALETVNKRIASYYASEHEEAAPADLTQEIIQRAKNQPSPDPVERPQEKPASIQEMKQFLETYVLSGDDDDDEEEIIAAVREGDTTRLEAQLIGVSSPDPIETCSTPPLKRADAQIWERRAPPMLIDDEE
jgi:hypothetical protein